MSKLAYVRHDGVVCTVGLDEGQETAVTPPGTSFAWPTWSPDGGRIVASGFRSGSNGHGFIGLYLLAPGEAEPRPIYSNEPGTDAIAWRTPHYSLWSPNSERVAFIAQSLGGLGLYVQDLSGSGEPQRLIDGGPIYLGWSPDSRFLLVHSGGSHYLVDVEGSRDAVRLPGEARASLYMTPSWSPKADRMAMFRSLGREHQALVVADAVSGTAQVLTEVDGAAAFAWRPDGNALAMVRGLDRKAGYYSGLWVMGADGSGEHQVCDDPMLCFSWSPHGRSIAYVTGSEDAEGSVRWAVVDVESGEVVRLADFRPSQEQLTTFMYFDQYVMSHSPWSPDGGHLVFSGALGYEKVRRPLPVGESTKVFVADVLAERPPRAVANGSAGFWRPV